MMQPGWFPGPTVPVTKGPCHHKNITCQFKMIRQLPSPESSTFLSCLIGVILKQQQF
jgi:hypothetical protein